MGVALDERTEQDSFALAAVLAAQCGNSCFFYIRCLLMDLCLVCKLPRSLHGQWHITVTLSKW